MKTFGQNLKTLRIQQNISQKAFAEKIGTTQQRVSEWECDKIEPTLNSIRKILSVLDVSFEELIEDTEYKTNVK